MRHTRLVLILLGCLVVGACDRIAEEQMFGSWTAASESIPKSWLSVILGGGKGSDLENAHGTIKTRLHLMKGRKFSQVIEVNVNKVGDSPAVADGKPLAFQFENKGRWWLSHFNGLRLQMKTNTINGLSDSSSQWLNANPGVKTSVEKSHGKLKGHVINITPTEFTLKTAEKIDVKFNKVSP